MRSIVYWPSSSSEHSSESETCKAVFSSSQLLQSCSLQVVVHFKPLARHWQFGSLQTEVHLQDKNSMMTSGAGAPVIQQMVSLSFSMLHPWPLGSGILGLLATKVFYRKLPATTDNYHQLLATNNFYLKLPTTTDNY